MEAIILGNPYDVVQGLNTPIDIPAYQAEQSVLLLSDGNIPIEIGSGALSNLYPLDIHNDIIEVFHIINSSTSTITLSQPTVNIIKLLTVNGLEYYEGIDFSITSGTKVIVFSSNIPYDSLYGDSIVKVIYTQVLRDSAYINASSILFDPGTSGMTSTDTQSAILETYNHAAGGGTWGSITGTLSNQVDLNTALNSKESSLGNPTTTGYVLSSTITGVRSWIASSALIGFTNSSPSFNTALGVNSLGAVTSGGLNTSIGYNTLNNITTGSNNTVVGFGSLFSNITGSNNTVIGTLAGGSSLGSNGLYLGNAAGYYETGDNAFYVNVFDQGNTVADKTNSLMYGKFNTTPSSQTLIINAAVTATYGINLPTGQTYKINGVPLNLPAYTPENIANKALDLTIVNNTLYPTTKAVNDALILATTGLLNSRGNYDASVNLYPSSGGSGTAGAIMKGDYWVVSVQGTIAGQLVTVGSSISAQVNTPGQTPTNWDILNAGLGFTPENKANKVTTLVNPTDTQYPSALLLQTQITALQNQINNANAIAYAGLVMGG